MRSEDGLVGDCVVVGVCVAVGVGVGCGVLGVGVVRVVLCGVVAVVVCVVVGGVGWVRGVWWWRLPRWMWVWVWVWVWNLMLKMHCMPLN